MRRYSESSRLVRATIILGVAGTIAVGAVGCGGAKQSATKPKTTSPSEATKTAEPTSGAGVSTASPWPDKVTRFAKDFKGAVWYPTKLPDGMKVDALDVLELEPGSGLVCDIFFVAGNNEIGFLQGSPKTREYEIVSVGKVPWGSETAEVLYEDPADTSSPKMIVYNAKGTLAELSGGTSFGQLKSVAASMVLVK